MTMTVDVRGIKEIDANLKRMNKAAGRRTVLNALRPAARSMRDDAKRRVAVRSGVLKKSIAVATLPARLSGHNRHAVRLGLKKSGWYGHFPEFGTARQTARPYMRPAYDSKRREAITQIGNDIWASIERTIKK